MIFSRSHRGQIRGRDQIQISALGMEKRKDKIVAALQKIFAPRHHGAQDVASRKFEGLSRRMV